VIAVTDVHYRAARATAAAAVAAGWSDAAAAVERVVDTAICAPYTPGELYRRELPPLLAVLAALPALPSIVVVDGFAWLGPDRPGLGVHLHRALGGRVAVVGVAKSDFPSAGAIAVRRGSGARPLWVSAIGIGAELAAIEVAAMHGQHRLPTLIVRADHLARGLASPIDPARNVKTGQRPAAMVAASTMSTSAVRLLPLLRHVHQHMDRDLSLRALASRARRSPFELHRSFRRLVGETTKQYTLRVRLDRAAAELVSGRRTILEIALAAGFGSHEVFTRAFRRRFGLSPSSYRGRGLAGPADRPSLVSRHAATVRGTAPCIGLYHLDDQETRRSAMTVEVTRRELTAQPALIIRRRIPPTEIAAALGECLPAVFAHAQRAGIPLAGPPFARYVEMGRGLMTIEGGMPIASPGAGEGEIEAIELPAGPAAVAIHVGAYDRLGETHAALEAWIEAQGLRAGGPPWEVYVTDPAEHPDPTSWRTEVIWPLAR
jgi:AraC family transcriptional regulator